MAGLKSFILFYIMFVFTLFNSNWAEKSLQNIPHIPNVHLLDVYEEADMNTHALLSASKIIKSSIRKDDNAVSNFSDVLKAIPKISLPVIAISLICGVKSFLHLFQLF